jgi:hypothetical protein
MTLARIALVAILSLLMVTAGRGQTATDKPVLPTRTLAAQIREYAHVTFQETVVGPPAICSATAIGSHALLTASHCERPTTDIMIDGEDSRIIGLTRDGLDHTIYLVDKKFEKWATFGEDVGIGDELYMWGNPEGKLFIFRKGYVVKIAQAHDDAPIELVIDIQNYHGDSGAGMFNNRGQLVTVQSTVSTFHNSEDEMRTQFSSGLIPNFSPEQMKQVEEFDGK